MRFLFSFDEEKFSGIGETDDARAFQPLRVALGLMVGMGDDNGTDEAGSLRRYRLAFNCFLSFFVFISFQIFHVF